MTAKRQLNDIDRKLLKTLRAVENEGFYTTAELAEWANLSLRTVQRAVADLVAEGEIVRDPPKRGRLYHPDFAPGRGGRGRRDRKRPSDWERRMRWGAENQETVATAGAAVGGLVGSVIAAAARPDHVAKHEATALQNTAAASRDLFERLLAGGRMAHLLQLAPEDPVKRQGREQQIANEVTNAWLNDVLEPRRRQLTAAIYAPAMQQLVFLEVLGFEPVGDPDPVLGLPRYFLPGRRFDFQTFGRLIRPGTQIERSQIGGLFRDLLAEVEGLIQEFGVDLHARLKPPPSPETTSAKTLTWAAKQPQTPDRQALPPNARNTWPGARLPALPAPKGHSKPETSPVAVETQASAGKGVLLPGKMRSRHPLSADQAADRARYGVKTQPSPLGPVVVVDEDGRPV